MNAKRLASAAALLPPLGLAALLLALPEAAAEGARRGLSVCAGVILPSLFPFLVLSLLLTDLGFAAALASALSPVLKRLRIPPVCAAPLLLGLCGGYPVGARALAELVRAGALTPDEASRMLPCCNNTGPGFIIGVAGGAVFGSVRCGALLYLCHALAALALALLLGRGAPPRAPSPVQCARPDAAFPAAVRGAAGTAIELSAYVVFFSVLSSVVRESGALTALAGAISARFGTELRFSTALLTGLLEIGSGVAEMRGMAASPGNLALAAFLLGFGGVSVHAQTLAAVAGTNIRCARHFAGRILHGIISAVCVLLLLAVRLPRS